MSLQLILGGSGSGKSDYLYGRILGQAEKEPDKLFFVIVPEQFTMLTQRELVARQERHAIMNVDVISFQRLAYRVLDEVGAEGTHILGEAGKNLLLRKIAEERQGELCLLGSGMKKTGYITKMKSVLSELAQYRIAPEDLDRLVGDEGQPAQFRNKIKDIRTMYREFRDYLQGKFVTAEGLLEAFARLAPQSDMLRHSVIALDGFTGFTPVQSHLLGVLMELADEVSVTLAMDEREDPLRCAGAQELFYMSKKTARALCESARERRVEVMEPHWVPQGPRGRFSESPQLLWLERNLFRQKPEPYPDGGPGQGGEEGWDITLHSLLNPRQELHFIASEILKLVREGGFRYKNIAVVCGDVEMYGNYAREIFPAYGIPLFLDVRRNIAFHPMTEFLRQSLLVLEQDFSYEAVFGYLRCGLSGVPMEEADLLENYVLSGNVRGFSSWKKKWTRRGRARDAAELERINALREQIVSCFSPLRDAFLGNAIPSGEEAGSAAPNGPRRGTVREESEALYRFSCQLRVEEQLSWYAARFLEEGENALAKEYEQIYRIAMDLISQMVDLLGDERMDAREYRQILEAGMEESAVGIIPPGHDRVVFGDIERTRLPDVKVLFLAGANDGLIPKAVEHGGIISQADRERFSACGMEIAPTDRERSFNQKFYLYLNLTKPSRKLYLTWFCMSQDGKEARKSYLVGAVQRMFPQVSPKRADSQDGLRQLVSPAGSMGFFVKGLKEAKAGRVTPEWKALFRWYSAREERRGKVAPLFEAAFYHYHASPIGPETVKALYGAALEASVSRLEEFSRCAYKHFLRYGLRLEERDLGEFAPTDMGLLFHEALARYSNALERAGYQWGHVPPDEEERLIEQAVEETVEDGYAGMLFRESRTAYLVERMKRILKRTVWAISEQALASGFVPVEYEVPFSLEEKEDEEHPGGLRLRGRIDRIDVKQDEGRAYVKVVDYKSGSRQFRLLELYHGLQMQLVAYLKSALELMRQKYPEKQILPGGMYYYQLADPVVEMPSDATDAEIQEKIKDALHLKGVVSEDVDDPGAGKRPKRLGEEEFRLVSEFAGRKMREIAAGIAGGVTEARPFRLGEQSGCDYCPFQGICGFDEALPGRSCRVLEYYGDDEEILARMGEDSSGAGEGGERGDGEEMD